MIRTFKVTGNRVMYDMISKGQNHVKFLRFVLLADSEEAKMGRTNVKNAPFQTYYEVSQEGH